MVQMRLLEPRECYDKILSWRADNPGQSWQKLSSWLNKQRIRTTFQTSNAKWTADSSRTFFYYWKSRIDPATRRRRIPKFTTLHSPKQVAFEMQKLKKKNKPWKAIANSMNRRQLFIKRQRFVWNRHTAEEFFRRQKQLLLLPDMTATAVKVSTEKKKKPLITTYTHKDGGVINIKTKLEFADDLNVHGVFVNGMFVRLERALDDRVRFEVHMPDGRMASAEGEIK